MSSRAPHRVATCIVIVVVAAGSLPGRAADGLALFETRIRPVLVEHCSECHASTGITEGGLALDHRDGMRAGGAGGPIIVPGDPAASRLLAILRHEVPGLEMPQGGDRLDEATIAAFAEWIAAGAADPRSPPTDASRAPADFGERRRWWSFQPLAVVEPPASRLSDWEDNPVDRFLLTRLDAAGLDPAPPAPPAALLRRLSYVLTGLPPEPEEVIAFMADPSAGAYEAAVDRMLASPRFGERFARHWMDLVRYCESHGSQGDPDLPNAWRYRDYLVRAFNADLPYDRFVREQIAGDILPDPRWHAGEGFSESAIGPAHLRMVELGYVPVDALDDQVKVVESQIDVYSKTFFGLTAACARCHDHKFDPITQEDFYALYGVFVSGRPGQVIIDAADTLRVGEDELRGLKATIRAGLAEAWLAAAATFGERLLAQSASSQRAATLRGRKVEVGAAIAAIEGPGRVRAQTLRDGDPASPLPEPFARWSFETDARDAVGGLDGELLEGAVVKDGRLVLDGVSANVRTKPLSRDLADKTLEAWVALGNLDQRGGGVVGLDVPEGRFFDAIVFGEISPRHWLAGSDFFNRSQDPGGIAETAGPETLVHVAISYAADGSIRLYRDGQPYGTAYTKGPLWTFKAGGARFLFGQRLSDINPPLAGAIEEARAYDRALGPEEVAASFRAGPERVTDAELLAALDARPRDELLRLRAERTRIDAALATSEAAADGPLAEALRAAAGDPRSPLHAWATLSGVQRTDWPQAWAAVVEETAVDRRSGLEAAARGTRLWDLRGRDQTSWFRHGTGLESGPAANGEITIEADGERVIGGILPAGMYTHLLSSRRPGVFQSPRFTIDTDSIFVRVAGRGSQVRLVVENYPLGNGGIYPAARPERDDVAWIRLDTSYRRGASAYVELTTDPGERGFFGVVEVRKGDGVEPPGDGAQPAAAVLSITPPTGPEELAAAVARTLTETVAAWRDDRLDDDGRALLDSFVRSGLLPTTLGELAGLRETVDRYRSLERAIPTARRAPGVFEADGHDQPLFVRGQHSRPAQPVPRRGLSIFGTEPFATTADLVTAPSGRLQLADQAVGPGRDLLARVMVNRLWHHVFGRGIVATTDNFGRLGTPPSHPELLDWLARRFIDDGWSVKRLLRLLVTSRAFRGASQVSAAATAIDPLNELVSHAPLRRLDAESIRDTILLASGQLDEARGGPGVDVHYTGKTEGGGPVGPLDGQGRRSIYQRIRRNAHNPFLEVFDAPKPTSTRGTRDVTAGPVQALAMLNDPFVIDQATKWGTSVAAASGSPEDRLAGMFLRAFARPADAEERSVLRDHFAAARRAEALLPDGSPRPAAEIEQRAWSDVAHAIMCLKELTYVE